MKGDDVKSLIASNDANGECLPGALLAAIDLDDFHAINARYGFAVGDQVMEQLHSRLSGALREGETLHRTGPDSFIFNMPVGKETPEHLGRCLCALIEAPLLFDDQVLRVRASIGIAMTLLRERSFEGLINRAELAQRQVRREGGGGYRFLNDTDLILARRHTDLYGELCSAIRDEQLVLHYQPQLNCQTGKVSGFEALVRWQHPGFGLLGPDTFVPVAERLGLMSALGEWVLQRAIADAGLLLSIDKDAVLAVNLSPRQLRSQNLPAFIKRTLEQHGLPPGRLELEITESCLLEPDQWVVRQLAALRTLGVRIALDDFGVGFCNLNQLQTLPIDRVKIDKRFLCSAHADNHAQALFRAMVRMLLHLSAEVLCEGVEEQEQLRLLQTLQCNHWQGFLASKPLPLEQVILWRPSVRDWSARSDSSADVSGSPTVLLVDDEPSVYSAICRTLRHTRLRLLYASNAEEALLILAAEPVDLIISDYRMPGLSGVEFLSRARHLYPVSRRILLTGHADSATLMQALGQGAVCRFITKPWNDEQLVSSIESALS